MARDEEFAAFVAARYRALVRTGWLLTGDLGNAEDLVQSALIRTYLAWGRLRGTANAEAYARRTLVRLALRARQRRWIGEITAYLAPGRPLYMALYVALIVFFCFFYTAIAFNPTESAANLRKYGGFTTGIR